MRGSKETCSIFLDVLPSESVKPGDIVASVRRARAVDLNHWTDAIGSVYIVTSSRVARTRDGSPRPGGRLRNMLECLRGTMADVQAAELDPDFAGRIWRIWWYPRGKRK